MKNYLQATDLLCFLQSQSGQTQCFLFFCSELQRSASHVIYFLGDSDDWDKFLKQDC